MAVNGRKTDANGDAILISLQEPYKNVVEVVGYTDVTKGETTSVYYNKQFRWGVDGVTYSFICSLTTVTRLVAPSDISTRSSFIGVNVILPR